MPAPTPKSDQRLGNCTDCGLNMDFVGKAHRCRPSVKTVVAPALASAPRVDNSTSPNAKASPNSNYSRNARWREKNRDTYNAGQRELMRKLRDKANV